MAEGVLKSLVAEPKYHASFKTVDSCGTGAYHVGDEPDSRTMSTLEDHGITDYLHVARTIRQSDFQEFDYIFAMDRYNLQDLLALQKRQRSRKAKVMLFGEFSGSSSSSSVKAEEIGDPYYGARDGFEIAYEQSVRFSRNFLAEVLPNIKS